MEQKRQNKQKRRAAFTLAEFLTVIAIVGILASLSFVAVIHYQRKLRRLEMDQTAKEIFLAAQNLRNREFDTSCIHDVSCDSTCEQTADEFRHLDHWDVV